MQSYKLYKLSTFAFLKSAQQTNNIWLRYKQTGVFETSGLLAKDNINSQKRFSNLKLIQLLL